MSRPQAYSPAEGYRYQILCRNPAYGRAYEHCDYASDPADKSHLLENYRLAYGGGWEFKTITLPRKYWPPQPPRVRSVKVATKDEVLGFMQNRGAS